MRRYLHILILMLIVSLQGCADLSIDTSGIIQRSGGDNAPHAIRIAFYQPAPIEMVTLMRGHAYTGFDKLLVANNTQSFIKFLHEGFRTRFRTIAAKHGITTVTATQAPDILKISIPRYQRRCDEQKCETILFVKGELFSSGDNILWSFNSRLRDLPADEEQFYVRFDEFAAELIDTLKKDGVFRSSADGVSAIQDET